MSMRDVRTLAKDCLDTLRDFARDHLLGMVIFAVLTGVIGNFVYEAVKPEKGKLSGQSTVPSTPPPPIVLEQAAATIATQAAPRSSSPSGQLQQQVNIAKWDRNKSIQEAHEILTRVRWSEVEDFCHDTPCIPKHELVGDYHFQLPSSEVALLLYASAEETSSCHGCVPYLSLFEFHGTEDSWPLREKDVAFIRWGTWGRLPPEWVSARLIGPSHIGIFLELSDMHQGHASSGLLLLTRRGRTLVEAIQITTGASNEGGAGVAPGQHDDWTSKLTVVPNGLEFYDLELTSQGIKGGQRFREAVRYRFAGARYMPEKVNGFSPASAR